MMYESRDSCPWYQSEDLDFDAAQAAWERQGQPPGEPPGEANYCDVCERTPGRLCAHRTLCLCDDCADTDEHREYCEMMQDGGADAAV